MANMLKEVLVKPDEWVVERMRRLLVRLLTQRFGLLPSELRRRVEVEDSFPVLASLCEKVNTVRSLDAMNIRTMELTWLGKAEAKGYHTGYAQGVEATEEYAVSRLRLLALGLLEGRFGTVSEGIAQRLDALTSIESLIELVAKIPTVASIAELEKNLPSLKSRPTRKKKAVAQSPSAHASGE